MGAAAQILHTQICAHELTHARKMVSVIATCGYTANTSPRVAYTLAPSLLPALLVAVTPVAEAFVPLTLVNLDR